MAKNDNLGDFLTDIANAIREKKGTIGSINAQNFASEIASIEIGGGEGGDTPTPDMPVIGDGKTYLYINISTNGRLNVPLYFSQTLANGVTIDWGDGGATQTLSGTGNVNTTHTYADVGEYVISLNPASGCTLGFGHSSTSYCVMGLSNNAGRVYCSMLQAVEIGKNITSIDEYAFHNCYSLTNVVIPQSITSIGSYAFATCYSLTNVVIPQSITSIGEYAFDSCSLTSVEIPQGVTSIATGVFFRCYSLTNVVIPQSITSIGTYAFNDCHSLTSVVIPQGVTSIGNYAFQGCYSLTSVEIPQGVTSIGNYTFNNCYSLASVVIPQGVTSIGTYAFQYCYALASVVIPQGVTSIGNYAFRYCYGMAFYDFTQCASVPTLGGTSVFASIPSDCKIVVPNSLYSSWSTATNWSTHASKMVKASEFNQ